MRANSDQQAPSSDHLPTREAATVGGPLDLLVAEDNPVNQMLIGAILRRLGHRVTCVDNGRLAVDAARERRFDGILMDMQMPEMDGLAATRAIPASGGRAPRSPCSSGPPKTVSRPADPVGPISAACDRFCTSALPARRYNDGQQRAKGQ